jgi:hypothetical protein
MKEQFEPRILESFDPATQRVIPASLYNDSQATQAKISTENLSIRTHARKTATTTRRDWLSSAGEKVSRRAEPSLRPLPESSRSSSKKPPRRSVEKMRASRLAHRKFAKSLCQAVGSQRVAGKSLMEKFRPRPGPLAKNRRGKMKAAQERSDQHAAAKHRTQSLPLPVPQAAQCSEHWCYAE